MATAPEPALGSFLIAFKQLHVTKQAPGSRVLRPSHPSNTSSMNKPELVDLHEFQI
jgi:hypothetical protein